jgi:hypothetical protein
MVITHGSAVAKEAGSVVKACPTSLTNLKTAAYMVAVSVTLFERLGFAVGFANVDVKEAPMD